MPKINIMIMDRFKVDTISLSLWLLGQLNGQKSCIATLMCLVASAYVIGLCKVDKRSDEQVGDRIATQTSIAEDQDVWPDIA
jgi:hypothetical protein